MNFDRWYYFLSLERDFIRTLDFVHLSVANEKTYSNEFAKLLLLLGSEVDVVAKLLCQKIDPMKKPKNIDQYREIITTAYEGMPKIEIGVVRYEMMRQPWASWSKTIPESPIWWKAYNDVKHERDKNFLDANQQNTLDALCGLLSLLLYYLEDETTKGQLQPYPELLDHGFPSYLVTEGGRSLPK